MIKILLIALAVIVAGGTFGWKHHEEQLNKAALQKATLSSCELANQALQQQNEAEQKATNGRFHGPPLKNCS